MSLRILIGVVVLCSAHAALAGSARSIAVEITGEVPVTSDELVAAMRVRIASRGAPIRAHVTAIPNGVLIATQGAVREVTLDGLGGSAAARLIALAVDDLFLDDLASPPAIAASAPPTTTAIAVLGGAAAWDGALGGLTLAATRARGSWLASVDVTLAALAQAPIDLRTGIVRLVVGRTAGWIDARAGLTIAPVSVGSGAGDFTVLAGGTANVRVHVPISRHVFAVIAAGADVFATRTYYQSAGMSVLATPWWAPWFAAGVEVTP